MIVHCIHICLAIDQLSHHPFYSQAGGQDQGCSTVIHSGIEVCHSVADQNLGEKQRKSPLDEENHERKASGEAALGSLRAAELYYLLALGTTMANH